MSNQNFSRSDAAAPRHSAACWFSVAPLRRCVSILLFISLVPLVSLTTLAQKSRAPRFDPDGSFWLHNGPPPNAFSDFGGINLNAKRSRHLPESGLQTMDGKTYRYRTLIVKRHDFRFTTVAIRGVSYSFAGNFFRGGVFGAGLLDDETPVLEGTLTKLVAGKKVAEAKMKFVYFGGT